MLKNSDKNTQVHLNISLTIFFGEMEFLAYLKGQKKSHKYQFWSTKNYYFCIGHKKYLFLPKFYE
jgi:hypothetical protein